MYLFFLNPTPTRAHTQTHKHKHTNTNTHTHTHSISGGEATLAVRFLKGLKVFKQRALAGWWPSTSYENERRTYFNGGKFVRSRAVI